MGGWPWGRNVLSPGGEVRHHVSDTGIGVPNTAASQVPGAFLRPLCRGRDSGQASQDQRPREALVCRSPWLTYCPSSISSVPSPGSAQDLTSSCPTAGHLPGSASGLASCPGPQHPCFLCETGPRHELARTRAKHCLFSTPLAELAKPGINRSWTTILYR